MILRKAPIRLTISYSGGMHSDPLISVRGDRAKIPLPLRVFGRYFFTGAPLRGPGDNATYFHRATVDYRARPYLTLTGPIWQRLARRHAAFTVPLPLAALAPWYGATPLVAYEGSLALGTSVYVGYRARRALKDRTLNKRYVDPAARVLCSMTSARYVRDAARRLIEVDKGWRPGDPVVLTMPNDAPLTDAKERQLVSAVGGRLGIVGAKGSWNRTGERVRVTIAGTPLPPEVVTLEMLSEAVSAAPLTQPVIGWGPTGPVHIDYVQDSPHVALSGAAGTGKTTLLRFLLAQRMAHGVGVIFLDAKRWSHKWAHRLPQDRAQYWYRVADMHEAMVALGDELHRRIEADEAELETFRTIDVVVEEINSLIKMLTGYWRGERKRIMNATKALQADDMDYDEADLDPPTLSPAVAALQYAVNMGRELRIHVTVAAQRLEANVFGSNSGAAVRQSFGLKLMARWDRALWKMLASGHDYVAWPGGKLGLWGFVQGTDFVIVRVPDISGDQAVHLATSGQVPTGPILGQQDVQPRVRVQADMDTKAITSAVTLAAALDMLPGQDGPAALSISGLRTAAGRPGFPAPLAKPDGQPYGRTEAKLYDLDELIYWRAGVLELAN